MVGQSVRTDYAGQLFLLFLKDIVFYIQKKTKTTAIQITQLHCTAVQHCPVNRWGPGAAWFFYGIFATKSPRIIFKKCLS